MRKSCGSILAVFAALMLILGACSSDDDESADTDTTEESDDGGGDASDMTAAFASLNAPAAAITVDGDPSDWDGVEGLDLRLEAIQDEDDPEPKDSTVKVAHDDENVYVLFQVEDDLNWSAEDAHLSGSSAILFAIDDGTGSAMGASEDDREASLGTADIWHWELECETGVAAGGAVNGPGDGDPGNDDVCNFDDEYSTTPEEREDDDTETGENSLLGQWSHTAAAEDEDGTWTFEMSRPLVTGDEQDAELAVGGSALFGVSYWDPDNSPEGWEAEHHVTSGNKGFIEVNLVA